MSSPAPPGPRRRIRITIAYDGADYSGWQVQPGLPTIQATLEKIVSGIEGAAVHVGASGRTDAGVHALAQVAAFDLDNPIPCENLRKAINRLLPPDIRILNAEEVHAGFNARHDAIAKTYEYRIWRGEICSPFERRYVCHHPYKIDEDRMNVLAPLLEGEHDFTSFAASDHRDHVQKSKIRTIYSSRGESRADGHWIYRVRGSGFLKHMVRNIVGVLLEAGKGNVTREQLLDRLDPEKGIRPGPTAPPQGLFLESVEY
ncbi:MAG TPA: tRNA pseudouridine(38-40) synthase TruA [Bryobacteraceae bacterium]|jgi:tRNA pseudouridine38-40 synthase